MAEESAVRNFKETVLSDEKFLLRRVEFDQRHFDGRWSRLTREVYTHGNAVALLPYDPARGTVLLTRQIRFVTYLNGHPHPLIEVCAGMLDGDEQPEAAIIREAREEIGCVIRNPRRIFDSFMSPGCLTERISFFVATYGEADPTGRGGGLADEGEDIEVLEITLEAAVAMIGRGEIVDGKTILLLQWAALHGIAD
jgi:nudix-type nucleoside diphosphatase (YffH/AdpP family)